MLATASRLTAASLFLLLRPHCVLRTWEAPSVTTPTSLGKGDKQHRSHTRQIAVAEPEAHNSWTYLAFIVRL